MQLSKRLDLFGAEVFAALNEKRRELEAAGRTVYDLSVGTPDFKPSPHLMRALQESAADTDNFNDDAVNAFVFDLHHSFFILPLLPKIMYIQ